jgi:hypothetical protein
MSGIFDDAAGDAVLSDEALFENNIEGGKGDEETGEKDESVANEGAGKGAAVSGGSAADSEESAFGGGIEGGEGDTEGGEGDTEGGSAEGGSVENGTEADELKTLAARLAAAESALSAVLAGSAAGHAGVGFPPGAAAPISARFPAGAARHVGAGFPAGASVPAGLPPLDSQAFIGAFLRNPAVALNNYLQGAIKSEAAVQAQKVVAPLMAEKVKNNWDIAWEKTASHWPDINGDPVKFARKAREIARGLGNERALFNSPDKIMALTATELFGMPAVNQAALDNAAAKAKEYAIKEMEFRNKAKAAVTASGGKRSGPDMNNASSVASFEDNICKEIEMSMPKGVFS